MSAAVDTEDAEDATMAHSALGPSALARVIACPGSFALSQRADVRAFPHKTSIYAATGSAAHAVAEARLKGGTSPAPARVNRAGYEIELDDALKDAVEVYTSTAHEIMLRADWHAVERRVYLGSYFPESDPPPVAIFGTADFLAYIRAERKLYVVDYKHGAGIYVRVQDNPQLMAYAAGAMALLINELPDARVTFVEMTVVQPNIAGGERVRTWTITSMDVVMWAAEVLRPAIRRAQDEPETYVPGTQCRFCAGGPVCPALHQAAVQRAKQDFDPVEITNEDLGVMLGQAEHAEIWIKKVRDLALDKLKSQEEIPGWGLAPTDPRRSWGDGEKQVESALLGAGLVSRDALYDPPKLKSPAQLKKALTAAAWARVEPLVQSVSSGLKLARKD